LTRIVSHILIWSFLLSAAHWHAAEWEGLKYFASNAWEHLRAGDSLWDFLQKHYGDPDTVARHYQDKHPGEKPPAKKPHHDIHLTDAALIYFPSVVPPVKPRLSAKNFLYRSTYTSICVRRCVKPPEAA